MATIESKTAFSKRRDVSKSAVSHWIRDKKIYGKALLGNGRKQKISVEIAEAQLLETMDGGQALGNGADTISGLNGELPLTNSVTPVDKYKQIKIDTAELSLKQAVEADHERQGTYVKASDVKAALSKSLNMMLNMFDTSVPNMSDQIASKFSISSREVNFIIREAMNETLAKASKSFNSQLDLTEQFIEDNEGVTDENDVVEPSISDN